jgi:hypothetical protein
VVAACKNDLEGKKKKKRKIIKYFLLALALSIHNKQQLYRLFQTQHSFSVTSFTLGFRLFFNLLQINFFYFERHPDSSSFRF